DDAELAGGTISWPDPGHPKASLIAVPPPPAVAAAFATLAGLRRTLCGARTRRCAAGLRPAGGRCAAARRCAAIGVARHHLGAVAQLVGAVDDDAVARRQALFDRDAVLAGGAELHRLHRHGLVVVEQVHEGAGRAALDCGRRHDGRAPERVYQQPDIDEL